METRVPVAVARVPAFVLLAAFGAGAWAGMVEPAAGGPMAVVLLFALLAAVGLIAVARRRPGRLVRVAATLLAALGLLVVGLLVAGVPAHLLGPRAWGELAAGIDQGLGTVPNVRTPYHGADEWTRSVMILGGAALIGLAALLAFAPRRAGAFGFPLLAALPLTTLYLVPVMQRNGEHQFWGGALFTLLLVGFLWLERVERRAAPMAAGVVAAAIVAGLVFGPGLDRDTALLDYEGLAQTLSGGASARYDWNHDYAPLDAREGREVLRVRAPHRTYWKAANLTGFDGIRWLQGDERPGPGLDDGLTRDHHEWLQTLRVTFRSLTSSQFVAAGTTLYIDHTPRRPVIAGPGTFATAARPLRRGNAYEAYVYAPRPTPRELRAATLLALPTESTDFTAISLPAARGSVGPAVRVIFPPWGQGDPSADDVAAVEASPYARVYELARRLRADAQTPYAYVLAVERYLARGFAYSEDPRRSAVPLADFLLRTHSGYCQQFSGAMALLLRMGGVPARVAAGFAPGSLDRDRREYVVRDIDAHSWVEAFFPSIGWVTRDPTPGEAPARSQTSDVASTGPGLATPLRDALGTPANRPRRPDTVGPAAQDAEGAGSSLPVVAIVLAALAIVAAVALATRRRRRRRRSPTDVDGGAGQLAELRRALRRSGLRPSPQTTLEALAERWRGTPAEGYMRVLATARYGYGDARPTPAQRAALRRELAAGGGVPARARAWWALPPQPPRGALRRRLRRRVTSTA